LILGGDAAVAEAIRGIYSATGARKFDFDFMGQKVYGRRWNRGRRAFDEVPAARETAIPLGRHLDGCRIGFDLGGSDRKAAAVIDGRVVFSEEIAWDPYFQSDPRYHLRRHQRFAETRARAFAARRCHRRKCRGRLCE
jgi:hypothetical protein